MLYNEEHLKKLYNDKNIIKYARITALTFQETPIETIEGRVTQGSINIDGNSALRRTCSLTIVADKFDYSDYIWGLKTKFKLEIGIYDNLLKQICWFKEGIFLISNFNTSEQVKNFTITIQGRDKMALLNGDMGGQLHASIDFGTIEEVSKDGKLNIRKIPIPDIIVNAVHQYAGEPYHNIVLKDLDVLGLELLEYRADKPMFMYRFPNSNDFLNAYVHQDNKRKYYILDEAGQLNPVKEMDLSAEYLESFTNNFQFVNPQWVYVQYEDFPSTYPIELQSEIIEQITEGVKYYYAPYVLARIDYGETAGYRKTDLTYAGDLIAQVGETLTSILDKIKNMLGDYEYFYDIDGQFVFQKKKIYINSLWTPIRNAKAEEQFVESLEIASANAYNFNKDMMISLSNNPNLNQIKNDYSIWGTRNGTNGAEIPIHLRYAIDIKPTQYTSIEVTDIEIAPYNNKYNASIPSQTSTTYVLEDAEGAVTVGDWREIIYKMAQDYYRYNHLDSFTIKVAQANPNLFPTGITGYEQYYTDIQGFWRQLYNPEIFETDEEEKINYYDNTNGERSYWSKQVYEFPEQLNFWFDFLDAKGDIAKFGVKAIGMRSIAINDKDVKAIYFRETPNVIFVNNINDVKDEMFLMSGYRIVQINQYDQEILFSISAQGKSAKNRLDELLYKHSCAHDNATLTAIPVYHLDVNTQIKLINENNKLNGEYVLSKITLPLAYNGTMSLTLTKVVDRLI